MIVTLLEAIGLVILVMFVFLQSWRTTLIPAIAVPVVMLGTFGVLAAAGYSINTLTLFALVLAIGLLVDDAIVVVENVERIMRTEGKSPRDATIESMDEITGALIGIALVLSAVFLPMAFFGGSTGVIYRQFSITIVSAMALSILVALILTPALCATLLQPGSEERIPVGRRFFGDFNRAFEASVRRYHSTLEWLFGRATAALAVYAGIVILLAFLFLRIPTSFLPEEDQGVVIAQATLPAGAVQSRTLAVLKQLEHHFLVDEKKNAESIFTVAGFSFSGSGQNQGIAFVHLRDWNERRGETNHAAAIATRTTTALSKVRDAQVYALVLPAVPGTRNLVGLRSGTRRIAAISAMPGSSQPQNKLIQLAGKDPLLANVRPNGLQDTPQLHVDIDEAKANALGLSIADVDNTLSAAWGSIFINQFVDRGRIKQVYMQGDAPFRMKPEDLDRWYVRGQNGEMAPFSSFARSSWVLGPSELDRYNGVPALEIQGQAAPGKSSGAAMSEMEKLIRQLPADVGSDWTGLSYQERLSGSQAPSLYAISILVVFLCLAALYESWSIPFSVLLVIPLGMVGAVLAATMRGLYNDIYFQVGLLATIGLSAKNADPHCGVRRPRRAGRTPDPQLGAPRRPIAAAPDPDDVAGFRRRREPARALHRGGRRQPERHWHRRHRRHDFRDRAGDLLRASLFPAGPLLRCPPRRPQAGVSKELARRGAEKIR